MGQSEDAIVATILRKKIQWSVVNSHGPCKQNCIHHKGKQRDHKSVFCKTCGIFILVTFTKPRKNTGTSCKCCNQRIRTRSRRGNKYGIKKD